ncbi:MAG: ATP-binding cassette domain-containing protein [Gammaproteobacteria bacterium]|nr:ATP-binding cassette domain-containing protein [Gammaproteobacteria bacterium]NIM73948.1 ATP-binding cassette domain-containing protein [Gammaproteobacteria bacterium]NIN38136.1 ATP-binding cassette domain-containing protein [Gammaproteobacteria bacterium]NIO25729.1 ATP-binding cassette domain-containing protein [Gammaproteobacteria bacterium]NIO66363.1 ATP-binding cassette domain-containing protein [Gammaproteobacteria bacterium]
MSGLLEVKDVSAGYRGKAVLVGVSFHVRPGGIACLLGPSGCGKTTLLRTVAGFEPVIAGDIRLGGRCVSDVDVTVPPEKRGIGMVFQDNALFPHLSVEGNIAFGLRGKTHAERRAMVDELLDVVGLDGVSSRLVHELSGGQQQRVALARALAPQPQAVLLDEPFSSLDADLRERIGQDVCKILSEREVTTLLVTHDQDQAFALADQIGVINQGRLLQWDTAYNLYHEPADRFIADFIGQGVFLRGRLRTADSVDTEVGVIRGNRAYGWPIGSEVDVLLRPDDILPDSEGALHGTVIARAFKGAEILYSLRLETGATVLSLFPSHFNHELGTRVGVRVAADHLVAFPAESSHENPAEQ